MKQVLPSARLSFCHSFCLPRSPFFIRLKSKSLTSGIQYISGSLIVCLCFLDCYRLNRQHPSVRSLQLLGDLAAGLSAPCSSFHVVFLFVFCPQLILFARNSFFCIPFCVRVKNSRLASNRKAFRRSLSGTTQVPPPPPPPTIALSRGVREEFCFLSRKAEVLREGPCQGEQVK